MKESLGPKTIVYPTPVFVVGTYDKEGKPNAMTVAWGGICCSRPPCVAVSLRKATYTYANIVDREAFTINIPSEAHLRVADYFGIASGKTEDKFATAGLQPVRSTLVDAPYIDEFLLVLECKLVHTLEIGLHTQFIGEILDVKADTSVLDERGTPEIEKVKAVLYAPESRKYFGIGDFLGDAYSIGKGVKIT
jgi:flavin reductase (DIM6/NTAB) family NADH-FMN oxidoreductase RutF